jgi:hypothetical protein
MIMAFVVVYQNSEQQLNLSTIGWSLLVHLDYHALVIHTIPHYIGGKATPISIWKGGNLLLGLRTFAHWTDVLTICRRAKKKQLLNYGTIRIRNMARNAREINVVSCRM